MNRVIRRVLLLTAALSCGGGLAYGTCVWCVKCNQATLCSGTNHNGPTFCGACDGTTYCMSWYKQEITCSAPPPTYGYTYTIHTYQAESCEGGDCF